jgi:predicted nuclease with TOPRIM domain
MLQDEINRVNSENKKLTEMLARVCEKYYALNNLMEELQSRKSPESVNFQNKQLTGKRKQELDEFVSSPIGLSLGPIENITNDKATVSTAYFAAEKSDTSLVRRFLLQVSFFECIDLLTNVLWIYVTCRL